MPVETIKCRECGSADVTEFRPGSYVCGHCEAIFKHVGVPDSASCKCGMFAIGRCAQCHIPVCSVHSSMAGGRLLCSECDMQRLHRLATDERSRELARAAETVAHERAEAGLREAGLCTRCGGVLTDDDAWFVDGAQLLCDACLLSALRAMPVEAGRATPSRVAMIEQRCLAGGISRADAERLVTTGHVSDEAWRLLAQLDPSNRTRSPGAAT